MFQMWLSLYVLNAIAVASVSSLEFYKGVRYPWATKEVPQCSTDACPSEANYTWDFYFDKILGLGAKSFVFDGYALNGSEIVKYPPFYPSWDEKTFDSLHQRTSGRSGHIMVRLARFYDTHVDEAALTRNTRSFLKKYPVDGFVISTDVDDSPTEWHSAFKALKRLGLDVGFELDSTSWETLRKTGIPQKADINFVALFPDYHYDIRRFNTDDFAKEAIMNATRARAKAESIILRVPLLARATYDSSDVGYSEMIYDLNADPEGNGSVIFDQTTMDGFYFFSQTRAVDKISVARLSVPLGYFLSLLFSGFEHKAPVDRTKPLFSDNRFNRFGSSAVGSVRISTSLVYSLAAFYYLISFYELRC
ncbi:hypothetical protein FOL47_008031 [Perkinsus chesapeaki]|uniref:Uncharacterized protein n=1 Tax=Perkinsus chesapeaki TaxID=330153 RepID=A0A7J6N2W5_PERCH|nr:hypothetical protein FOL47_008031 [Perkinsus chesapeaki]